MAQGVKWATDAERTEARRRSMSAYRARNREHEAARAAAYYVALPAEVKQARLDRAKLNPAVHRRAAAKQRILHPERVRARRKVGTEIAAGRLQKLPCYCGETKVQAHHPRGYEGAAALDVEWLCGPHHREAHRQAGA